MSGRHRRRHVTRGGPSPAGPQPATAGPRSARSSSALDGEGHCGNQTGPVRLWPGSPTLAPLVVNATELGRCTVLSSIETATAASTANNNAAIKLFIALPLYSAGIPCGAPAGDARPLACSSSAHSE